MKTYDYAAAKKMIQLRSDLITSAKLGMEEDWFWTAISVYEEGKFTVELDNEPEIAGITGSFWATPSLMLVYKEGNEELIECFTGESDSEKPEWFSLGEVAQPMQDEYIARIKIAKLT